MDLSLEHINTVRKEVHDARNKWKDIALELGMQMGDIANIKSECNGNKDCLLEVLQWWLKRVTPKATWDGLVEALKSCVVGECHLADDLQKKYCQQGKTPKVSASVQQPQIKASDSDISDATLSSETNDGNSQSNLPYLDTSALDEDEKEDLVGRLLDESMTMMTKFQTFVSDTYDSLKERVTADDLRMNLRTLHAWKPVSQNAPEIALTDYLREAQKLSSSVTQICEGIMDYVSFLNFDIIEHLINRMGTDKDKINLQNYKKELNVYCKRRVYECPPNLGPSGKHGNRHVVAKVDEMLKDYTLQQLLLFRSRLSKILHIDRHALRVVTVHDGCMRVTFEIPELVANKAFPLSEKQEEALEQERVIELTCGEYEFLLKNRYTCRVPFGIIKKLTECSLCKEQYQQTRDDYMPRFLSCGHTACASCLKKGLTASCILCPVCQEVHTVINKEIQQFPVSHHALEILRALKPFLDEQSLPQKSDIRIPGRSQDSEAALESRISNTVLQMQYSPKEEQAVNDCVPEKLPRLLESAATEPGTDVAVFNLDSTFDNILEKVTTENFQLRSERAERAMHVEPITEEKMYNVADKILLKVLDDSSSSAICASLCRVLSPIEIQSTTTERTSETVNFRKVLLRRCQHEFEAGFNKSNELKMKHPDEKSSQENLRLLRAVCCFIGELFKAKLLCPKLMKEIIGNLLKSDLQEDLLQCCAKLLTMVGQQLEKEIEMDICFRRIQDIIDSRRTSAKTSAMLNDVMKLKRSNCIPKSSSLGQQEYKSQLTIKPTSMNHRNGEPAPKRMLNPEGYRSRQQPISHTEFQAIPYQSRDELLMPWEHYVCHNCFKENPYAVWLIKQYCFQQQHHQHTEQILVAVDPKFLAMTQIRPAPRNRQKFQECYFKSIGCKNGLSCQYFHSSIEANSWNTKKRIKANPKFNNVKVHTHSPSEVCQKCFISNAKAVWLAWLRCLYPKQHSQEPLLLVVIHSSHTRLVRVRPPLKHMKLHDVKCCPLYNNCQAQDTCCYAHSEEELQFWKWKIVNKSYADLDDEFEELWRMYSYPCEDSIHDEVEAMRQLSRENYKTKYHKLVYLDELEHSRKMITECNGLVTLEDPSIIPSDEHHPIPSSCIARMNSAAIEYAIRGYAQMEFVISGHRYLTSDLKKHKESDTLLISVQNRHFFEHFQGKPIKVHAHFEINHKYFKKLRQAIDNVNSDILEKLFPESTVFTHHVHQESAFIEKAQKFDLDEEYQTKVLKQLMCCSSCAPYLIVGPFGTGKTYVIAATLAILLKDPKNRILVCTQQHICADAICHSLQERSEKPAAVLRLFPNEQALYNSKIKHHTLTTCTFMKKTNAKYLNAWSAIITTFGTALNLKTMADAALLHNFSHILVDEGAQAREPEVLESLILAKRDTKIVIAGDNQQVGPQVLVLSNKARENGLGTSLIERLAKLYDEIGGTKTHVGTLLTNYRSHPSILMLASSLLYEGTLLSRSDSKPHPKAPYPILFACTSLHQDGFADLPAQNESEAQVVVKKMLEYIKEWPRDRSDEKPLIGLLATTKQQVALLRQKFNEAVEQRWTLPCQVKIIPTFLLQGEEYSGIFLSTCEPTDAKGNPRDPVTSISNQHVINTVITRARSLVFAAGNPFFLNHLSKFWGEYVRRCLQCQTLLFPVEIKSSQHPQVMKRIHSQFSPYEILDEASELCIKEEDVDHIVQHYMSKLHSRKEYKTAQKLVQDPQGKMSWVESDDIPPKDSEVWCHIECENFYSFAAIPTDSTTPPIKLKGSGFQRGVLQYDVVKVDTVKQCILFDYETERALASAHFGKTFICKVNPNNPIEFVPLDKRDPKFVNLPTLTKHEKLGVVCFDPMSIKKTPKVKDFIPIKCALKMLFVVKFLGWQRKYRYPLGIIIGTMPMGKSLLTGEMVLRMNHGIPLTHEVVFPKCQLPSQNELSLIKSDHIVDAFTIGSTSQHDSAFTCHFLNKQKDTSEYLIGVHISDIHSYATKGCPVDLVAAEQGCAVYHNPDQCIVPDSIISATRFLKNKHTRAFSVFGKVRVNGTVQSLHDNIEIRESILISSLGLTYPEVQTSIDMVSGINVHDAQVGELSWHEESDYLPVKEKLKILWKFASYLRYHRLGESSCYFPIIEHTMEECVESHFLVEELMIWTNHQVARKLLETFPDSTIIRTKKEPERVQIQSLIEEHQSAMSASLVLSQYLPQPQISACNYSIQILRDVFESKLNEIRRGNVKQAHRLIQFEHLHPQLAVVHSLFEHTQSPSMYQVSITQKKTYCHAAIKLDCYTHCTTPSKRYIDIVIQRQLHASLNKKKNPYTTDELKSICAESMKAEKFSNDYMKEFRKLYLASELQQSSKKFLCFVTKVKERKLFFCFQDLSLKSIYPSENSINLRDFSAFRIPQQGTDDLLALTPVARPQHSTPHENLASWKVKMCSIFGSPKNFLANSQFQQRHFHTHSDIQGTGEITLYIPEDSYLIEKKLSVKFQPQTYSIPFQTWKEAQSCVCLQQKSETYREKMLTLLQKFTTTKDSITDDSFDHYSTRSPIWIYEVHRTLQPFEVLQMQLSVAHQEAILIPCVQLVEVAPGLEVCIQHNSGSVKCFVDELTESATAREYRDIKDYIKKWEKLVLAEAACCSLSDANLLLVKDVIAIWPKLTQRVNSAGEPFYQLPQNDIMDSGVQIEFPRDFRENSYEFFKFSVGDLICMRYNIQDTMQCVFHMVVHHVDGFLLNVDDRVAHIGNPSIYLSFAGEASNYISSKMEEYLKNSNELFCELQLIPLALPYRRIYNSLKRNTKRTELSEQVALGRAQINNHSPPKIEQLLPRDEASIATALWPIPIQSEHRGKAKLNRFQQEAIAVACRNNFSMIQGPPGTGKTVTGAHLAYALVIKLREEMQRKGIFSSRKKPCVMYCGPSHQSVDVVLDMLTSPSSPVNKSSIKIIRIYSKNIERNDFPGPKHNKSVEPVHTETTCDPKRRDYALHHIVHQRHHTIMEMDKKFEQYYQEGKICSQLERTQYQTLIADTEVDVLSSGIELVLCTCNEASSHRIMESLRPRYCIIDECAMATEPECMIPIWQAENVVLIGDHMQLQPIIHYKTAGQMGLKESLFERYVATVGVHPYMLKTQYRMHRALCEFPSDEFYNGKLETDRSVALSREKQVAALSSFWPQEQKPFVFCNIVGEEAETHTRQMERTRVGIESKYNEMEAKKIVQIARILIDGYEVSPNEIVVLTPYSAQKVEIEKQLKKERINDIAVKTITESQGSEYGIVLLSTVRSKPLHELTEKQDGKKKPDGKKKMADIGWRNATLGFVSDRHHICVGITRCKYGMVIVGNKTLLSYSNTWNRLIKYYEKKGCVKQECEFPPSI